MGWFPSLHVNDHKIARKMTQKKGRRRKTSAKFWPPTWTASSRTASTWTSLPWTIPNLSFFPFRTMFQTFVNLFFTCFVDLRWWFGRFEFQKPSTTQVGSLDTFLKPRPFQASGQGLEELAPIRRGLPSGAILCEP